MRTIKLTNKQIKIILASLSTSYDLATRKEAKDMYFSTTKSIHEQVIK